MRLAAPRAAEEPRMLDFDRRRFLGSGVALAGAALGSGVIGRVLLESRASAAAAGARHSRRSRAVPAAPPPAGAELRSRRHHAAGRAATATSTGSTPACSRPRLDVADWRLTVDGMVDRPFTLDYAELLAMPLVEQYVTIACVSNEVGGNLVGNALWRGVPPARRCSTGRESRTAPPRSSAARSTAGLRASRRPGSRPPEREALVAVAMNGEPLPPEHGFPARLIVPGLYGYVSATKWLTNIQLTTLEGFDGYWVPLGWAKEAPILTQSRIDVPRGGASVAAGQQAVAGVAWAPDRGVDGGRGAGRRWRLAGGRALHADLRRHLGAVALPLGGHGRRPHAPRPCHRRRRSGADGPGDAAAAGRRARPPHHHGQRRLAARLDGARRIGSVPAPRAPLVIVNPAAGMGLAHHLEPRIRDALAGSGVEARLLETREPGHAERLAAAAADLGHDRVVAVGGDGTIQEVVNGLMAAGVGPDGERPALGIVPGGSGNDVARSLNLPMAPLEALAVALGGSTQPLDLGRGRA